MNTSEETPKDQQTLTGESSAQIHSQSEVDQDDTMSSSGSSAKHSRHQQVSGKALSILSLFRQHSLRTSPCEEVTTMGTWWWGSKLIRTSTSNINHITLQSITIISSNITVQ